MPEIFVYGTLKRGGKWHHLLENELFVGEDSVQGEMYLEKNGYYPILYVGSESVPGEIYLVSEEAYKKVVELESDADYDVQKVKTTNGIEVTVFYFQDMEQKSIERKIDNFDAQAYFDKWLSETDRNSDSFKAFLEWGGKQDL